MTDDELRRAEQEALRRIEASGGLRAVVASWLAPDSEPPPDVGAIPTTHRAQTEALRRAALAFDEYRRTALARIYALHGGPEERAIAARSGRLGRMKDLRRRLDDALAELDLLLPPSD